MTAVSLSAANDAATGKKTAKIIVYATAVYEKARIILTGKDGVLCDESAMISPVDIFEKSVVLPDDTQEEDLKVEVCADGRSLIAYQSEKEEIPKLPDPAKAADEPSKIMTNEELYLTGQHIEQYRHATWRPDPYYLEGLKRDPVLYRAILRTGQSPE